MLQRLADRTRRDGDDAAASGLYKKAIAGGDDSYEAHMGLGISLANLGDTAGAEKEYKTARTMQPSNAEPEIYLGRLYLGEHKPELALPEFDAALTLSPGAIPAWNGKGYSLDMLERHREAHEAYRKGLAIAPDDLVLQNNYGLSLALSGDYDAAIKQLTTVVQEPGATARNRQNLALALGLAGHQDDASFISKTDLSDEAIRNNLRYYESVRHLPPPTETAAVPRAVMQPSPPAEVPASAAAPAGAEAAEPHAPGTQSPDTQPATVQPASVQPESVQPAAVQPASADSSGASPAATPNAADQSGGGPAPAGATISNTPLPADTAPSATAPPPASPPAAN